MVRLQNRPLKATDNGSFLWPSVKLILNKLSFESKRTASDAVCRHAIGIINKPWHSK